MKNKLIYALATVTTVIYAVWRIGWSLPTSFGVVDMAFGILLLIGEIVGFLEANSYLKGMTEHDKLEAPIIDGNQYPAVDVFIATYNESVDLLTKTINGCKNLDYPDKSKVHIYLCDDTNRDEMKKLSQKMEIGYITRQDNKGAKAGNYNNALRNSTSPLIATLDADMIPMHDFLMATVPYFFLDRYEKKNDEWVEKDIPTKPIGFIQTPQSFYNADLFQYNLFSENSVPNEQDFFFQTIQSGRNSSNAVIYAGSNTVLSRKALEEVGGFYESAITEDLATGLRIQINGYQCYAIDDVHANGLAPTEIEALFKQRDRWARGCIQTFRQQHLLTNKKFESKQRATYLASLLYWYTPLRKVIFLIAPILFSVFNIHLLDCSFQEIVIFWLPHYICYSYALSKLSGNKRTTRLSNIYDTILAFGLVPGVILETLGIKKEKFAVTGKIRVEEKFSDTFKYAIPHFLLALLSVYGLIMSLNQMILEKTMGNIIVIFWLGANLYMLLMAIFFVIGRKYYRSSERYQVQLQIQFKVGETEFSVLSSDISEGGISFTLEEPIYLSDEKELYIKIQNEEGHYCANMKGKIIHIRQTGTNWRYAMNYEAVSEEDYLQLLQIIYDRLPTLPTTVNHHSSFFEDAKNNILKRQKGISKSQRALPRVALECNVVDSDKENYIMRDFNYSYLRVYRKKAEYPKETIFIENKSQYSFECELDKIILNTSDKEEAIYKVINGKAYTDNLEFAKTLKMWNMEYLTKMEKLAKLKKLNNNKSEYEFNERNYLNCKKIVKKNSKAIIASLFIMMLLFNQQNECKAADLNMITNITNYNVWQSNESKIEYEIVNNQGIQLMINSIEQESDYEQIVENLSSNEIHSYENTDAYLLKYSYDGDKPINIQIAFNDINGEKSLFQDEISYVIERDNVYYQYDSKDGYIRINPKDTGVIYMFWDAMNLDNVDISKIYGVSISILIENNTIGKFEVVEILGIKNAFSEKMKEYRNFSIDGNLFVKIPEMGVVRYNYTSLYKIEEFSLLEAQQGYFISDDGVLAISDEAKAGSITLCGKIRDNVYFSKNIDVLDNHRDDIGKESLENVENITYELAFLNDNNKLKMVRNTVVLIVVMMIVLFSLVKLYIYQTEKKKEEKF